MLYYILYYKLYFRTPGFLFIFTFVDIVSINSQDPSSVLFNRLNAVQCVKKEERNTMGTLIGALLYSKYSKVYKVISDNSEILFQSKLDMSSSCYLIGSTPIYQTNTPAYSTIASPRLEGGLGLATVLKNVIVPHLASKAPVS